MGLEPSHEVAATLYSGQDLDTRFVSANPVWLAQSDSWLDLRGATNQNILLTILGNIVTDPWLDSSDLEKAL
jgi:hypothetical protein